tara:strand:+ start:187 stop:492 length:306 start_codon:yes stop_codon:yes gene_type:complete
MNKERYHKSKIYSIICKEDNAKIYIGSTTDTLSAKFSKHKFESKQENKKHILLYQTVNGNWGNYYIELIEDYKSDSIEQLKMRENQLKRQYDLMKAKKNIV